MLDSKPQVCFNWFRHENYQFTQFGGRAILSIRTRRTRGRGGSGAKVLRPSDKWKRIVQRTRQSHRRARRISLQANLKYASLDADMKIINQFDNEHDAREHLSLNGFTQLCSHNYGTVFTNNSNYQYLLLRKFHGQWEIQQPETEEKNT